MTKVNLLSSCGAAALLAVSAGAAFGQSISVGDVTQTTNNSSQVSNLGTVSIGGISGDASSVSITATGAASAVSLQTVNGVASDLTIGDVKQDTTNHGQIDNDGVITGTATGISGHGASASVSATGAQSAASASRVGGTDDATETVIGSTEQKTTNTGNVRNDGVILNTADGLADGLSGNGSSVSASATGASSAVSASSINAGGTDKTSIAAGGSVKQTTLNRGEHVKNYAFVPGAATGDLSGHGSAVSISATGAASSVSVSRIASAPLDMATIGDVQQDTTNHAAVTNRHAGLLAGASSASGTTTLGDIKGQGASASISATGAASSVSYTSVAQGKAVANTVSIGDIMQRSTNFGRVVNSGPTEHASSTSGPSLFITDVFRAAGLDVGDLTGAGTSATIGATGAAASISVSKIDDASSTEISLGNVKQDASNGGFVMNIGDIFAGSLVGNGAAVSISSTGAVSSASYSNIDSGDGKDSFTAGDIKQTASNSGDVANAGEGKREREFFNGRLISDAHSFSTAFMTVGDLIGTGSSASSSASGAVSVVSISSIDGEGSTTTDISSIDQGSANSGDVVNLGDIEAGSLEGAGTSVSVTAIGSASSVSIAKVDNGGSISSETGPVTQDSKNSGEVNNVGVINALSLNGNGAGVSVSATGASSQVSTTRIDGGSITTTNAGVTQSALNQAPITNTGAIVAGDLAGTGTSVSISGAGAVSQVSFATICTSCSGTFTSGPISQTSLNSGSVSNTGTIGVGSLTGNSASASVSALGAGSVVSGSFTSN